MAFSKVYALLTAAIIGMAGLSTGAWAQSETDVNARIRARVAEAKLLALPKPPAGVRDLHWSQMSPPGWDAVQLLRDHHVHDHDDAANTRPSFAPDRRAAIARTSLRQEWDSAPTVPEIIDTPVRLFGLPILLDSSQGLSKSILLVPYLSDGDRRPHPPANQMVVVYLKPGLPRNLERTPVWITGSLYPVRTPTALGQAAYLMPDAKWHKYPFPEYPLPRYALPR